MAGRAMKIILNVAEKPSVAKEVTKILSNNQFSNQPTESKFNPIYDFEFDFRNEKARMKFTSVRGHLMNLHFPDSAKNWKGIDPAKLFHEPIFRTVEKDNLGISKNLQNLSNSAQLLILWLDCDREGEAIAYEVIEVCTERKRNIEILRAHFSAVTKKDIFTAMANLKSPDPNLAEAVNARQELDLRIGASFTRFQTLTLQTKFSSLSSSVISFGPCQFPTLGFVVDRFKKVKNFISEPFWYISCKIEREDPMTKKKILVDFLWSRNHLFDKYSTNVLYEMCLMSPQALISKVQIKEKLKYRPAPLCTIEMQKLGTRKLSMSSDILMSHAEKLYQKGYISYPRTETDTFSKTINLHNLVGIQKDSSIWGEYASSLLDGNQFMFPKNGGHDDKAHPPIHPVKILERNQEGISNDEWRVYELVTRHFLACCSKDARGGETTIELKIAEENFLAKGLLIKEYNYLTIYIYDKWSENTLPDFKEGEVYMPKELFMKEGKTSPPSLLTEAELIGLMDKNGIGTDATIHEHIKTIQDRNYAAKQGTYFKPTNLGVALVDSYEEMGLDLAKPVLRASMESKLNEIAKGRLSRGSMVKEVVEQMEEIFRRIVREQNHFLNNVKKYYVEDGGHVETERHGGFGSCGVCSNPLSLSVSPQGRVLICDTCNIQRPLPKNGEVSVLGKSCPLCNFPVLEIQGNTGKQPFKLCPKCYTSPPVGMNSKEEEGSKFGSLMPCFKCNNSNCEYSTYLASSKLFPCTRCNNDKYLIVKRTKVQTMLCSCEGYPACKNSAFLPDIVENVVPTTIKCPDCEKIGIASFLAELKFKNTSHLPPEMKNKVVYENNSNFCLRPGCDSELQGLGYKYSAFQSSSGTSTSIPSSTTPYMSNTNNGSSSNYTRNNNQTGNVTRNENVNFSNRSNQPKKFQKDNLVCFRCNKPGHIAPECPDKESYSAKNGIICYKCKQPGHTSNQCPENGTDFNSQGNFRNQSTAPSNKKNANLNRSHSNNQVDGGSKIVCYKCSKPGHLANSCPGFVGKRDFNSIKNASETSEAGENSKSNKFCPECGANGRHPRNSKCSLVKRRKPKGQMEIEETE